MNTIYFFEGMKFFLLLLLISIFSLGITNAQTSQKPISSETLLLLEMMKQNQAHTEEMFRETNKKIDNVEKKIDNVEKKIDRITYSFDIAKYILITVLGSFLVYVFNLYRNETKQFITKIFSIQNPPPITEIKPKPFVSYIVNILFIILIATILLMMTRCTSGQV